jgi:hypothetical protein
MTSDKSITANRRNARLSTGPRTEEGKDAVRQNALKHGLLSASALLPTEDLDEFTAFSEAICTDLKPVGEMENLLVDRIISTAWRLRRAGVLETGILAWYFFGVLKDRAEAEARHSVRELLAFPEPPVEIINAKEHARALREAEKADLGRRTPNATLGQAFVLDSSDANSLSKLSRYEAAIQRSFHRSLHELRELQDIRKHVQAEKSSTIDVLEDQP